MATGDDISFKLPPHMFVGRSNTRNRLRALRGPLPGKGKQQPVIDSWEAIKLDIQLACREVSRRNRHEDFNAYGGRYWSCVSSLAGCLMSDIARYRREEKA